MIEEEIYGIIPAAMSILKEDLTLDMEKTLQHAEDLLENGSNFVLYSSDSRMVNNFIKEIDYIKSLGDKVLGKEQRQIINKEDLGDVI